MSVEGNIGIGHEYAARDERAQCLEVRDNGIGIELPQAYGAGLGLVNLRSRAERLGGSFEILTGEEGTRLAWRVPA